MADAASDLAIAEYRMARRLARLFRIERTGPMARRPRDVADRLIDRRGTLIERLMRLEYERRAAALRPLPELDAAMSALAAEIDGAERFCLDRLAVLDAELARRRGRGTATGLRDGVAGQLLGQG